MNIVSETIYYAVKHCALSGLSMEILFTKIIVKELTIHVSWPELFVHQFEIT